MELEQIPPSPRSELVLGCDPAKGRAPVSAGELGRPAILLNANAKRVDEPLVRRLRKVFPSEDLYLSYSLDEALGHVQDILTGGYTRLLIGGGDGTVASTLDLIARVTDAPQFSNSPLPELGILRLGTGNALASWTGAGHPIHDARRVLRGEVFPTRPLRVLEDPDRGRLFPFGSMGYDAQMLNDYVDVLARCRSPQSRRLAQSLAGYVYALFTRTLPQELFRRPCRVRVVSQGPVSILDPMTTQEIPLDPDATLFEGSARALVFGSSPYYGYGIRVLPYAERRRDRFQLRVSTASIPYLLAHLPKLWRGTLRTDRAVDFLVEDVRIENQEPLPLQYAGDPEGWTNALRVRLSKRDFRLLQM